MRPGSEKQVKIENHKLEILLLAVLVVSPSWAQVASHAPTLSATAASAPSAASPASPKLAPMMAVTNKPVVRVNGTELTDRDLLREMLTIFPYARQHNGFPKAEEAEIRMGALKMIEFEELVYQEAVRRGMSIAPAKLRKAEADFRAQFPSDEAYNDYLKTEMQGSKQRVEKSIRRSLLIDAMLKSEVQDKSKVTLAEARAYYDKNPKQFVYPESFAIQSISIMPSDKAGEQAKKDARKRAEEACQQAKATKSYEEFGLLAEKLSEDDFHVNMGDHHAVERAKLPPEILKLAGAMKPGEVSDVIQLGNFYTCFRLNEHKAAGKVPFEAIKDKLRKQMEKNKSDQLRAGLDKKLRQNAKVQEL